MDAVSKHPVAAALADALHEHIVRHDLTPTRLSVGLGVTPQYVHKLLRADGFPSPELQYLIRKRLGVDFNAVLDRVDGAAVADWRSDAAAKGAMAEVG